MGKDQELLDAARNGNITFIDKYFSERSKRSGKKNWPSLRRGPGANIQDSNGYSALHYAALNGHIECVKVLLMHEASPNLPDNRGSSPLHLAAWAGHHEIVKLLLTQANRPANPNLQAVDNETPLHCAAQHGHTGALTTLLAHGANPNMENSRCELPLDLAAQYGRLQAVQILVRAHPELLLPYKKPGTHIFNKNFSPLHLASRNGHKHVVEVLLAAGVDVNLVTQCGTALHEAALCGKDSVVKILLEFGADLSVTDSEGRTALDLLKEFPPHVTRGIVSVINNYQNSLALSSSEQEDILKVSRNISSRESYNDDQSYHSRGTRDSHAWSTYSNDANSMLESPSSSDPASPRMRTGGEKNGGFYVTMTPLNSNSKVSPTPPKKPPRRNLSISPSTSKSIVSARSGSSSQTSPYEYLYLAQSGDKKSMSMSKAASVDQCQNYVKMMSPAAQQKHDAVLKEMSQHLLKSDGGNLDGEDDEPLSVAPLRSYNPNRKLRRIRDNDYSQNGSRNSFGNNHNDSDDRSMPMSPSSYRQPPTPDHPPPNAQIAEKTILERIRPLSQEYRRSMAMLDYIRNSHNGTATFGGYENRHRVNSEKHEKREKRQSVPQPLKQHPYHHYEQQQQQHQRQRQHQPQQPKQKQQQQQHHHQQQPQYHKQSHQQSTNQYQYQSYQGNSVAHPSQQQQHPPSQMYSHRSSRHRHPNNRDSSLSPCSSDVIMSHSLNASSGSLSSSDRSASTDCVEYVTDVPFAGLFKGSTMTLDNPNLITYNTSNANLDYKYYQSMASEQQQQQQQQPHHTNSYRSSANNNHHAQRQPTAELQSQKSSIQQSQHLPKSASQYHHRPERPKTLDTQPTKLHGHKANIFNAIPSPINNVSSTTVKTPASEDEQRRSELSRSGKTTGDKALRLSVPNSAILAQKLSSGSSGGGSGSVPFDEQEEWKKISEIMANFGTDSDILNDSTTANHSNRRRDFQNRCENGRSNSVAGFTFSELDRHRNAMKSTESSINVQRRSGTQSPHGQLMNFLYDNNLDELSHILYDNGYDDIDFIKGILDESDFETMDVKPELRKKLLAAIENDLQKPARAITAVNKSASATGSDATKSSAYHSMNANQHDKLQHANSIATDTSNGTNYNNNSYSTMPKQKHDDDTTVTLSVNDWLDSIRLAQYADVFRKHLYTDMERISRIWEIELQAVLEINKIGHRKRILYSVGATPPPCIEKSLEKFNKLTTATTTTTTAEAAATTTKTQDAGTKPNASQRSSLSISSHDSNKDSSSDHPRPNHRKNRQAPKPPTQQPKSLDESVLNNTIESTSNLEIRAPSELLLGFPTGLRTQWRHSAEILITGSVKYEVNYLGSTVIKELRGTESTKKSIQKLKKNEKVLGLNAINSSGGVTTATTATTAAPGLTNNPHHNAKRAVNILISYRGVQFIDPELQNTICEHEIRNINCACQDADDLSHFAYITKDSDNDTHYCHVFNVVSMDLATEIILTLGQAFEVAYQIALRKSTPTTPIRSPVNSTSQVKQ